MSHCHGNDCRNCYEEKNLFETAKQVHREMRAREGQRMEKIWKENIKNHKDLTKIYLILCALQCTETFFPVTLKSFNASSHFMDEQNRE